MLQAGTTAPRALAGHGHGTVVWRGQLLTPGGLARWLVAPPWGPVHDHCPSPLVGSGLSAGGIVASSFSCHLPGPPFPYSPIPSLKHPLRWVCASPVVSPRLFLVGLCCHWGLSPSFATHSSGWLFPHPTILHAHTCQVHFHERATETLCSPYLRSFGGVALFGHEFRFRCPTLIPSPAGSRTSPTPLAPNLPVIISCALPSKPA